MKKKEEEKARENARKDRGAGGSGCNSGGKYRK